MELHYNDENWRLADIQWKLLRVFSFQSKYIYIYNVCEKRQIPQDYTHYLCKPEHSVKLCKRTERWSKTRLFPDLPETESSMKSRKRTDRQTDWQTDRWMKTTLIPDLPESSMKLCRMADRQTDRWTKTTLFQSSPESSMKLCRTDKQTDEPRLPFFRWLPESSMKLCRTDRQTDRWTKTSIFPVVTWEFNEGVQDRQTDRQTDRWTKTTLFPMVTWEFNEVVQEDRQTDDPGLSHFQSIDPRQNVDGVGAKHSQHAHVHIVQHTCNTNMYT